MADPVSIPINFSIKSESIEVNLGRFPFSNGFVKKDVIVVTALFNRHQDKANFMNLLTQK